MQEAARRRRLRRAMTAAGLDGMLVTHGPDVRYLTGFTGSSGAVAMAAGKAVLFTDGRYATQAKAEAAGVKLVIDRRPPAVLAAEWMATAGVARCGFEAGLTTVEALGAMRKTVAATRKAAKRNSVKVKADGARSGRFVPTHGIMARQREIKDADEITRMRRAAALGCSLFEIAIKVMRPGVPEMEVAAQIELAARRGGADGMSFETIVASGVRSALPHGRATTAKLPRRGFVTLDFGVMLDGYCSDMTRTVHLGKAGRRERDVYHSVLAAEMEAVRAVRAGVTCGEVDEAARSVLRQAGLEKAFSHSTGHGVGLEIHEAPRIAANQKQRLEAGMVITIEPGAYLQNEFGVRIEDMVLVTEDGGEVLTAASSKELMEIL